MNETKFTRFPFFPLSYGSKHMAVPRELMIDYTDGGLYIKSKDGLSDICIASNKSIEHITDYDNPHKVTKKQLGLENVINVKQASDDDFQEHLVADNPHNVEKSTIGLDRVRNYDVATVQDVIDGRPDKYITPAVMAKAVEDFGINIGKSFILTIIPTPDSALVEVEIDGVWVRGKVHIVQMGSYNYRVSQTGFDTVEDNIVMNTDKNISVVLEGETYNVDFAVDPPDSLVEVEIDGVWTEVDILTEI